MKSCLRPWEHITCLTPNLGILAGLFVDTQPPCCCLVRALALVGGSALGVRTGMKLVLIPSNSTQALQGLFLVQAAVKLSLEEIYLLSAGSEGRRLSAHRAKTRSQGRGKAEAGLKSPCS